MKKIKYLIFLLLIGLVVGCGESKDKNVGAKKLEPVDLVLGWYPNAFYSFLYAGIEKGYFEDENIKVNIHFPSGTGDSMGLVAAKKADIGFSYMHKLIMARANQNIPVKVIGANTQGSLAVVMALASEHITRPKDLENKLVGYSGGPLTEGAIDTMMKYDGGDPSKVKIIDVGFELLPAMITQKVNATIGAVANHEVPVMEQKGFDVTYFYPTNYGVPNYYESILIANDEMINKKKDLYTRFLKACVKGALFVKENPEEATRILIDNQAKEQFPLTYDIELASTKMLLPFMFKGDIPYLHQDKEVWENNINWMYEKNLIDKKIAPSEMYEILYEQQK